MNLSNTDKSKLYTQLMYNYDQLSNRIADIKSENFELNQKQLNEIQNLKKQQNDIMMKIQRMM